MENIIELGKIYTPVVVALITVLTIVLKTNKKKDDALVLFMENVSGGNAALTNRIDLLLQGLDKHINPVCVANNNSASIIKDALFSKQGVSFVALMMAIYEENGLCNTDRTLAKIESKSIELLHSTDQKLRVIKGMQNYIVDFGMFIVDVKDTGIFENILDHMRKTKKDVHEAKKNDNKTREDKAISNLKYEVAETYNITVQKLNEKYSF